MEKLIIERVYAGAHTGAIRVDPEILDQVKEVSQQTGISSKKLVDMFCEYALAKLEIVDPKEKDEKTN